MSDQNPPEKAKVYKANFMLQQKVGSGPLEQAAVERMQKAIDNNDVDFTPLGEQFLKQLEDAIAQARASEGNDISAYREMLTSPIMQLKANAAIFHFNLVGNLANVILSFLEAVDELDRDAVEIIQAHHTTLNAIIKKKMKGDGGEIGAQMVKELKDACARYYAKKKGPKK